MNNLILKAENSASLLKEQIATNLQQICKKENYALQNVTKPQLFEDIFPYDQFPRIVFDNIRCQLSLPEKIYITDTTFRDGQQARPPFTVEQIVTLYDFLNELSGSKGAIRMSEFFVYSQKDQLAVKECLERGYDYPKVTGWIRAIKNDLQLVKELKIEETGILTSASDYHIFFKLNMTRQKAMDKYLSIVTSAIESGIVPRCHLEDITRADLYGFVLPFVQELMKLAEKYDTPVKIRACDTLGIGLPFSEVALPRSVPKIIYSLHCEGGVPSEWLEWHGHNDFHKVHSNSFAAWLYGAANVNGTLLGIGERAGNSPIEGLVTEMASLYPDHGINTAVLTEIGTYMKSIGVDFSESYPLLGDDITKTSAGVHADGVLKNERVYSVFDPQKLLNRPFEVAVTDKSGLAGVAYWVQLYLKRSGIHTSVDKTHPGVKEMHQWVTKQYESGRTTAISDREMIKLGLQFLPEYFS
ncbi:MAG: 2-isopropylmalate synthase [Promethearchaeota archaeon]